jgi:hypothetical protein
MRIVAVLVLAGMPMRSLLAQTSEARIEELDRKLKEARQAAAALQRTIDSLAVELAGLRSGNATPLAAPAEEAVSKESSEPFRAQIIGSDLGSDESSNTLSGRPELFVQARYQSLPIAGTNIGSAPSNFLITRMESRWSGRISEKAGAGFEIQYHPAPNGAPSELVNDAFVEYYPSNPLTIRVGQFVKPFGFDIQQSSSVRESPERGIFAGYFFPGQRDRGLMLSAKLDALGERWQGTQFYAGVFNGNRFFQDSNRQLNYNLRFRKLFSGVPLAVGLSAQIGRQLAPPGTRGTPRENLYGADVQWTWHRLGVRAEFVAGDMPSTLVSLEPEFTARYRPGAHSAEALFLRMCV